MAVPLLETTELTAGYGKVQILDRVSLRVDAGDIIGVIGPNGAGKSTLLKVVFGYLAPWSGSVRYNGHDIGGCAPERVVRLGLGFVPQVKSVFPHMTVAENLALGGYVLDRSRLRVALARLYDRFPLLYAHRKQPAGTLSGGERRLLEIARVMMSEPSLVLLDEPSAALAPKYVDEVYATLGKLNSHGTTLLIVEQNVDVLLSVAHRVYALQLGANAYHGSPVEFRDREDLRAMFLGGDAIENGRDGRPVK